jgi:hypothetical protein
MLHHELVGRGEREEVSRLLAVLAAHENGRCVPLAAAYNEAAVSMKSTSSAR